MRRLVWLCVLAGLGCSDARPPNLLLVSADTLRADHLSTYGYARPTSPALDRLAAGGVVFEQAVAPRGSTWPSLTTLLSARHPRRHGVRGNGMRIGPGIPMLAEWLRERGFATGAFLTNMTTAEHRGFDTLPDLGRSGDKDAVATARAIRWMGEQEGPFFCWLHWIGPHSPYQPGAPGGGRFDTGYRGDLDGSNATLDVIHREQRELSPAELAHLVALYDADVAETDARLDRVLRFLDHGGLAGDTLVVFTSDHGEELYDHNRYFRHALSIYASVLHVPLVMRWPGRLPEGVRVPGSVGLVDVAPTILDLLGLDPPPDLDGRSLLPRLEDPGTDAPVFSELGPRIHSVRRGRWHYIANPDGLTSPGLDPGDAGDRGHFAIAREELYDVSSDPAETRNLAAAHPDVVRDLRAHLERFLTTTEAVPFTTPTLAPDTAEELRTLGYID